MIGLSVVFLSIALVISIIVLAKGSDLFTEGSKKLAEALGITYTVVGFLVVSLSTTLPENTVSIYSAITGSPEVAFGNAVGSIIFNVGVAVAVNGLIRAGKVLDKHVYLEDIPFMLFLTGLAWLFSYTGMILSRIEGALLFVTGVLYYYYRLKSSRGNLDERNNNGVTNVRRVLFILFLGLAMVILGSSGLKESGVRLAKELGVPEVYISIVIIAVGTSIPELATSIASAIKGVGEISVGNVIGANIIDLAIALGLAASICPIPSDVASIKLTYPFTMIIFLAFELIILWRKRVDKILGIVLLTIYSIYVYLLSVTYILPA